MSGERSDWNCPSCDSSDVHRVEGDLFQCEQCGLETSEAREARVSKGAAIYLSDTQLDALDVGKAQKVRYWVNGDGLHVEGVSYDG